MFNFGKDGGNKQAAGFVSFMFILAATQLGAFEREGGRTGRRQCTFSFSFKELIFFNRERFFSFG